MNSLDLLVLAAAITAAVGGYRLGLLARVTSWVGMGVGAYVGIRILEPILSNLTTATPAQLLLVTSGTLLGTAFIGQAIGIVVGRKLHIALPFGGARQLDRVAGGGAGAIGVFVALWLLLPIMGDVRGWAAVQSRTSSIAEWIDETFPDPPDTMATLRRFVGDGQFPRVFDALQPAPDLGPPPEASGLSQATLDAVVPSTVKVEGVACRRIQEGSGFVVGDDLIATNAHVVAGESRTIVERSDGSEVDATVVAFDPARDLAILSAPGLNRPVLPRGDAGQGDRGAVFGHPGGGPLRVAPFEVGREVTATGTDIYDRSRTERDVLILSSELRPGDSGGALVDASGAVVGVAFAIAPDKAGVAYALATSELDAILATDLSESVDTGPCLQ
ncbi:MAG: MarP family serine protease [Actinomycetota bacterium]|nr:MarP family serine protease [Actinomycetota bacterium]